VIRENRKKGVVRLGISIDDGGKGLFLGFFRVEGLFGRCLGWT